MRRIAWLTDVHLNFVPPRQVSAFLDSLDQLPVDVLLFGGDISESSRLLLDLSEMVARIRKPIYFVLGSHDYFRSSIQLVRFNVAQLCQRMPNLCWLNTSGVVELSPNTALIGHDGWGDGLLGNFEEAAQLQEELQIEELTTYDRYSLFARLSELGQECAAHLEQTLGAALERYDNICLLTHVPPFAESCWYEGSLANERMLPRFTCAAAGRVIQTLMADHPTKKLTVLCGHTHSSGSAAILPNVRVWTGGAQYGSPQLQRLFWVP
jgi:predicted MPP superfamily phosphohydrolase